MNPIFKSRGKSGMQAGGRIQAWPAVMLVLALQGSGRISPLWAEDRTLASVSGVVSAEDTGKPLKKVLVRVSSPAVEMRSVRGQQPGLYDGLTDENGRFTIQVPRSETISLNAFAPGYEEAAGMWMSGNWTFQNVPFPSSQDQKFNIKLRPAVYVAGVVTDESGLPLSGVDMEATIEGSSSTAYVAFDKTAPNGRFEIFDFPLHPTTYDENTNAQGRLTFRNWTRLTRSVKNIYTLSAAERTNLHVALSFGCEVRGTIISANGQPTIHAVVEAVPADKRAAQRTSLTDVKGRFVLPGLPEGEVSIQAHTPGFDQQARQGIQLAGTVTTMNLTLEPVVLKGPPQPVTLLGLKLANVTPELQQVYNLDSATGVVILDPGTNHLRLGIGELSLGESFWVVGKGPIKHLREMVTEILRIDAIAPPGDPNEGCHGSVRVVYDYRNGAGTMTQRLKLTDADRAELKNFLLTSTP